MEVITMKKAIGYTICSVLGCAIGSYYGLILSAGMNEMSGNEAFTKYMKPYAKIYYKLTGIKNI